MLDYNVKFKSYTIQYYLDFQNSIGCLTLLIKRSEIKKSKLVFNKTLFYNLQNSIYLMTV